jgi:uncharacterized protein YgbK (DUF1537 family)
MPPQIGVLADDLTGAHASATALRAAGLRPVMGWGTQPVGGNAVVVDMRTRDETADERLTTRRWACELDKRGVEHLELRVDSTLRGSTSEELAGVREALGPGVLEIAIPAYPRAGRTTLGGVQRAPLGIPVAHEGDVSAAVFGGQRSVTINMRRGPRYAASAVLQARSLGARHFVFDAAHEVDLRAVAEVVHALQLQGVRLVTISPGAWLRHLITSSFVMVVAGSATETNRAQLASLPALPTVYVEVTGDAPPRIAPAIVGPAPPRVVVIETLGARQAGDTLMHGVADAAFRTLVELRPHHCAGIIVTGGHTAAHLVDRLSARSVVPLTEPEPLCAAGLIQGGPWDATFIITKGGLIGDPGTLARLCEWLLDDARADPRTLPAAQSQPRLPPGHRDRATRREARPVPAALAGLRSDSSRANPGA